MGWQGSLCAAPLAAADIIYICLARSCRDAQLSHDVPPAGGAAEGLPE